MTRPWSQVGDFRKFRCEGGRPGVERVVWSRRHFQGGSLSLSFRRHHCYIVGGVGGGSRRPRGLTYRFGHHALATYGVEHKGGNRITVGIDAVLI